MLRPESEDLQHRPVDPRSLELEKCITVTEHIGFNVGNAVKYLWRADRKGAPIQDLRKAGWYVDREIAKREREQAADDEKVALSSWDGVFR